MFLNRWSAIDGGRSFGSACAFVPAGSLATDSLTAAAVTADAAAIPGDLRPGGRKRLSVRYGVWPDSGGAERREYCKCSDGDVHDAAGVGTADLDTALDAARRGDERGFTDLWVSLNPLILRYLWVLVGQCAEDVASETWLHAARDVREFRGDAAGFRVWLFRVARHRALDEMRRAGRRPEDPSGLPGIGTDSTREHAAPDDTADAALERLSTEQALQMIAQLPKNQREAVMLRVIIGLDAKQTAQVLGKRAGAVRIAAMRGLRGLSGLLSDAAALTEAPPIREALVEPAGHARSTDSGAATRATGFVDEVTP